MDQSGGRQSDSGGNTEEQHERRPKQSKSKLNQEFPNLSRCPDCYNHKANFRSRWGSESSSSDGDSGPEVNLDSEAESVSSSSSSTGRPAEETPVRHSPVRDDTAGGQDGDRRQEASESPGDEGRMKVMVQRAQLTNSLSLPAFVTPQLTPLSLLPRPPQVTSTLHLQVLPQKHNNDTFYTIRPPERRGAVINNLLPFVPFPWQQQPPYHQPDYIPPLSPQGQRLPPPLHTLPMLHAPLQAPSAPYTHLHTLTAQPCWCRYCMYSPYTHWSHYSSTQLS
ncbi:uncharacterized protein LOC115793363 [Archocentrus centrarchus]|uniref:uncharacterized protein LOC115793363 n=1 Tax=Archocentrus centrarchus TaxID=63155 RepID=UPI0011E9BCF1|nr:uncharacterized protein LOC115793363 [Archocentrus centrarchus]